MEENPKARAEMRTDQALRDSGYHDPRQAYRARLKQLRENDLGAFQQAVDYYERVLVPRIAEDAEPLSEWIAYGQQLGELSAPGRTVAVDATGRAHAYTAPIAPARLVLHLPGASAAEALALLVPEPLSEPQLAAYELLINRARSL